MPRFKKRPVTVYAIRKDKPFEIITEYGILRGKAGDWLVTISDDDRYPCDDETFRKNYEPIDERGTKAMKEKTNAK